MENRMENVIIECLEDRFAKDDYILPYSWDTDESLEEVLTELFHSYGYQDHEFSVETHACFANASYSTGYCAIAWTFQNYIHTYNFQWEVM